MRQMRERAMRTSRMTAWITALAIALTPAVALAEPTAAEKETARSLMKEGRARREKGDHKGALENFTGADNIMKVPTTGLEVGRSQTDMNLLVEARDTFLRISRMPEEPGEPVAFKEARKEATALAAKLEERIPTVKLSMPNLPKGAKPTVTIDDAPVSAAMLPYPVKVNPGKHSVVATVGSFKQSAEVELIEGEDKEVPLDMAGATADEGAKDTPPPPAPDPNGPVDTAPKPPEGGTSSLVYIGFGVGGAALLVGGVTGILAMSKTNSAKEQCEDTRCPPSTHDDLSSARTMATVSTISFVVAAVGVGVGVYGLLGRSGGEPPKAALGPLRRVEPFIGLGSFGVSGSF